MEELKTSSEWIKNYNYTVMDPDGWDRTNFQYSWFEEKITKAEFERRVMESTVLRNPSEEMAIYEQLRGNLKATPMRVFIPDANTNTQHE